MSHCKHYQELIEEYLAEEISATDRTRLDEHCTTCNDCRGLLEMHQSLMALDTEIPLPEKQAMREMRETVLAATTTEDQTAASHRRSGFITELGHLWRIYPLPAVLSTAAILVCAVFLGRWSPQDRSFEQELMQQALQWNAGQSASLDDYWDSPFSYANVTVRQQESGELALSFDASRHVDMQVPQDSPLAREVLLHAIMEPSSLGSRLRAMEVAPQIRDELLKEALVSTMLNDPDPTVRVNALAVLAKYPFDQNSQDALVQTVSQDQDVQMRLTAMEELKKQNVSRETISKAVNENDGDGVLMYLHEEWLKQ